MDKQQLIKKILFGGILASLCVPMLLTFAPFIEFEPLEGYFEERPKPDLTFDGLYSGEYQKDMEAYLNDNTGGRPYLVRINNQMEWSLFRATNVSSVVVGKDDYLLEQSYIDAYYGYDFIGEDAARNKVKKLQEISDSLAAKGTKLIVVIAPGKVSYFPEKIPAHLRSKTKSRTNYQAYRDYLKTSDLHFIDYRDWIIKQKRTAEYPLFPKRGIHWTSYAEVLVADSMIQFMNSITPHSKIDDIVIDAVEPLNYAYNRDQDIEESMNLLFNLDDGILGYPKFRAAPHSGKKTTKVLTIGDSYFWGMYDWGLASAYFNDGPFWYYNREIYPESFKQQTYVQDIEDYASAVEENDVVLLLFNESNLKDFAYGFVDRLHAEYFSNGRAEREKRIAKIIEDIYNTPAWLESIKEQAKNEGITLEKALRKNAVYMITQEDKQ